MLESLKESLNFLLMSLSLKKNDNSRDSNLILNTIHMKRIKQEKLAIELEMSVLKKTEETIYDKLNQKHFKLIEYSLEIEQKLRESYEILLDCKKNMIQLDTVKGTLNDILYLPEDASIDDIMRYRLERIDVNFDDLSDELKNVNVEVTSKTMSENLNEIEAQLKLFPSAESNAAERINFYSNKLMESNIAVKTIKDTVEQDEKEFLIVKNIRMKKFTDCLNELNETILETYIQLKYNNTSTAFFSIVNEDEPFKDGVRLTFWNNPSMEEGEDETFLQALAIMLSVIK